MSEGTVRVKKAATEFNISVQHLVEFLASKGFSVESNPNAKISDEMYQFLQREFGQDKKIKEQASQIHIGKSGKEDLVLDQKAVSQSPKARAEQKEVLIKGMSTTSSAPLKAPAKKEVMPVPAPTVPSEKETPFKEKDLPQKAELKEDEGNTTAKAASGLTVLGKIDLSASDPKPAKKGPKKSADATMPPPVEQGSASEALEAKAASEDRAVGPEADPNPPVGVAAEAASAVASGATAETTAAAAAANQQVPDELIRAKADRLQGTTVLGKIDVTQFEKRKPVASSEQTRSASAKGKEWTVPFLNQPLRLIPTSVPAWPAWVLLPQGLQEAEHRTQEVGEQEQPPPEPPKPNLPRRKSKIKSKRPLPDCREGKAPAPRPNSRNSLDDWRAKRLLPNWWPSSPGTVK